MSHNFFHFWSTRGYFYLSSKLFHLAQTHQKGTIINPYLEKSDQNHSASMTIEMASDENIASYFRLEMHRPVVLAHIVLMILAWMVLLPIGKHSIPRRWAISLITAAVMLSVANSRTRLPVQLVFVITNCIGALLGGVYSHITPDLYEKQKHSPVGWVSIVFSLLWLVITLVPKASDYKRSYSKSFHGNQRSYEALLQNSHSSSFELEEEYQDDELHSPVSDDTGDTDEKLGNRGRFYYFTTSAIFSRGVAWIISKSPLQALRMLRAISDRCILVLGFLCIVTGVVVFSGSFVSRLN